MFRRKRVVETQRSTLKPEDSHIPLLGAAPSAELGLGILAGQSLSRPDLERWNSENTAFGMHCPDLRALGRWILDAEPLLTAGLTPVAPMIGANGDSSWSFRAAVRRRRSGPTRGRPGTWRRGNRRSELRRHPDAVARALGC